MKRMHVGLKVDDLEASIAFYTKLFGAPPSFRKPDYAKWMVDDPRLNFSIDLNGEGTAGAFHLGIQVESGDELAAVRAGLDDRGLARQDQNNLVCGYQTQDKSWLFDPQGVAWEAFHTYDRSDHYYGTAELPEPE